jgi:type I restriction enzyme S subunit
MSANVFLTKWSGISGDRFDPLMVLYKKTTQAFKYEVVSFKDLLLSNPMYGANEAGIDRTDEKEPRYIRITDIDEFGNLKDGLGVTAQVVEEKYFLNENDLLFARSGATVGKAYIHRNRDYECFFAGYMIKFVVDSEKIDPYYVFLYTQLDIYKKWVSSIQRAAGQPNINAEEYKSLPIPIPPKQIQEEIVTKIQNAYKQKQQKENEAKKFLDSIDEYLLKELGINLPKVDETDILKRVFLRKWSEISGDRFDSIFHKTTFKILMKIIGNTTHSQLKDIVKFSSETWDQNSHFEDVFPYIEISEIDISYGTINNINYVAVDKAPSRAKMIVRDNDIIISTTRPNRGAISLVKTDAILIASTGFCVIRDIDDKVQRDYLFKILKSSIVLNQFDQRSSGGNYPAITQEEIGKVIIPLPSIQTQNKISNHIENIKEQAKSLKQQATNDFEKAKQEVEAMLLGGNNDI